jgi:hypothetical protein
MYGVGEEGSFKLRLGEYPVVEETPQQGRCLFVLLGLCFAISSRRKRRKRRIDRPSFIDPPTSLVAEGALARLALGGKILNVY